MNAQAATAKRDFDAPRLDNMGEVVAFLGEVVVSIEAGLARVQESEQRRRLTGRKLQHRPLRRR